MAISYGYQCDFMDSVSDDFYCKKCKLVARNFTLVNCCSESFCQVCIEDTKAEGKPCPECGNTDFTTLEHVKIQKRINCLQVYCNMKERGCRWTGPLDQLDTHLDPDQDNCQYVDTKCPLNCHMAIPKNKVEQHVAKECVKRDFTCQHCNFKATYEEVIDKHLTECKYVPLQCPNFCGVTFERDFLEDHMKICRLQEIGCEFNSVGCDDQFTREDQEEHIRQNSQKHLTLTASLAAETKEQLLQKMVEQDKKHKEEEERLREKIKEQEKKIGEQEMMIGDLDKKFGKLEKMLGEQLMGKLMFQDQQKQVREQKKNSEDENEGFNRRLKEEEMKRQQLCEDLCEKEKKISELEEKLTHLEIEQREEIQCIMSKLDEQKQLLEKQQLQHNLKEQNLEQRVDEIVDKSIKSEVLLSEMAVHLNRKFEMKDFSIEKGKDKSSYWMGPVMYTHLYGYKFCIGVDANGFGVGRGNTMWVDLWSFSGEHDNNLKWPVKAEITLELVNQKGGENVACTVEAEWKRPATRASHLKEFHPIPKGFLGHSKLKSFLNNDTLYFYVSKVKIL